jgi:hypothetical protein
MTYDSANQDAGVDAEFRSLSIPAAVALALGLASPTALATPAMLIVPVAAVLLAWLALVKIRASGGASTGARLAQLGLALGLASFAAVAVRGPVRDALLRRQARAVAGNWLTLIADGRLTDAVPLMSQPALQALAPHAQNPDNPPPKADDVRAIVLANLAANKALQAVESLDAPLSISAAPAPGGWPIFDAGRTLLMEDYAVGSASPAAPLHLQIRLLRTNAYEAEGLAWRVDSWELVPTGAAEPPASDAAP